MTKLLRGGLNVAEKIVKDWFPTVLLLAAGLISLLGFIGGTYFQGAVSASGREAIMESVRRRDKQNDDELRTAVTAFTAAIKEAQSSRGEIKGIVSDLAVKVGQIEGALLASGALVTR